MSGTKYCEFASHLFVGEGVKHLSLVKWKLTHGAGQLAIYIICRAPGMDGVISVMHCANLKQKWYKDHPVYVYGIASGYEDSRALLMRICDEAEAAGMGGRLAEYLERRTGGAA